MSIQSLLTLLTEIREFVSEFTMRGGSVWGQAFRVVKKVLFRQSMADRLDDFHRRIDQYALGLNIYLTISAEDKRWEELIALRNELNAHSEDLMEELWTLKGDPAKLKELLEALREEVGEGNAAILREIKFLQHTAEGEDGLSMKDLVRLGESLKASNEGLVVEMAKHKEVIRVKEEEVIAREVPCEEEMASIPLNPIMPHDGIELLQAIYTLHKQLNDNQEACLLLCDRV
eukprot:scaffold8529_cov288-Ochromonas_danica.AAC.1